MVTFDGYELPNVEEVQRPRASRRRAATPANWRGEYSLGTIPAAREITVSGLVMGDSWTALDAAWDEFNAKLAEGPAKALSVSDGRFYFAEVSSVTEASSNLVGAIHYEVTFFVSDPYEYATATSSASLGTTGSTVAVGGKVTAEPVLSIVVTAAPEGGLITVTNAANGRAWTLAPEAVTTYSADSRTQRVTRLDGTFAEGESGGKLLLLEPGSNVITIAATGGATLSGASVSWHNTFRN